MGDPERLLSAGSDADELERTLLQSLRGEGPSSTAKAQAWQGIAGQLGAVTLAGAAASAVATSTAAAAAKSGVEAGLVATASLAPKAVALKLTLAMVLSGAAVGGGAAWMARDAFETPAHSVATQAPRAPAPVAVREEPATPSVANVPSSLRSRARGRASTTEPTTCESGADCKGAPARAQSKRALGRASEERQTPPRRSEQLLLESKSLAAARAALHGGDAKSAQQLLDRLDLQVLGGVLTQEREVLRIEVLAALGQAAAVERRVRAFIAAHPESPHSSRLARFLEAR